MRVQRETFTPELFVEMIGVVQEHNDEICAVHGDLNPYLEVYFLLEGQGLLDTITARTDEDEVIGYYICMTSIHHHHADLLVGSQMALYVKKDYRGQGVSGKLLSKAEEVLTERGATSIVVAIPAGKDHSKAFDKLGYEPMEHSYYKNLGD